MLASSPAVRFKVLQLAVNGRRLHSSHHKADRCAISEIFKMFNLYLNEVPIQAVSSIFFNFRTYFMPSQTLVKVSIACILLTAFENSGNKLLPLSIYLTAVLFRTEEYFT